MESGGGGEAWTAGIKDEAERRRRRPDSGDAAMGLSGDEPVGWGEPREREEDIGGLGRRRGGLWWPEPRRTPVVAAMAEEENSEESCYGG